jgi:hypothetical protein
MLIAVDFDGVIVSAKGRSFSDTTTPLTFMPGARDGLYALKRAGHKLLLYSARSNRAMLYTPEWDPLVRAGVKRPNQPAWTAGREIHWARYRQMLAFCEQYLHGLFDAIDDGMQGKPMADLFIDDRSLSFGDGADRIQWHEIALLYGAPSARAEESE